MAWEQVRACWPMRAFDLLLAQMSKPMRSLARCFKYAVATSLTRPNVQPSRAAPRGIRTPEEAGSAGVRTALCGSTNRSPPHQFSHTAERAAFRPEKSGHLGTVSTLTSPVREQIWDPLRANPAWSRRFFRETGERTILLKVNGAAGSLGRTGLRCDFPGGREIRRETAGNNSLIRATRPEFCLERQEVGPCSWLRWSRELKPWSAGKLVGSCSEIKSARTAGNTPF
jgi:hypothetical protein